MSFSFSADQIAHNRTGPHCGSGIDREVIYRVRHQARIERAKIVCCGLAGIRRAIRRGLSVATLSGRGVS